MRQTPLERWIRDRTGEDLAHWQLICLNRTLALAAARPWHQTRLPGRIRDLSKVEELPTMGEADLIREGIGLCCVSQREIERMVTLDTSGSTGPSKRVCFTGGDLRITVDFFRCGLSTLVRPGDRMAIFFPCTRPGGLGRLIEEALEELGGLALPWGPVISLEKAASMLAEEHVETLVGPPVPILALARYCQAKAIQLRVRAVLLSADYVPHVLYRNLEKLWGCEVYMHYGMTEMGLGCAVDCDAHEGLHIRENDLLVEIVDSAGRRVPDGTWGEVVFTTLTRQGMPFIRYRTGDISQIRTGVCTCGSQLRRLAPPAGRRAGGIILDGGTMLWLPNWDEVLFAIDGISDFYLAVQHGGRRVTLEVETQEAYSLQPEKLYEAVSRLMAGRKDIVEIKLVKAEDTLTLHPFCKRTIRRADDIKKIDALTMGGFF